MKYLSILAGATASVFLLAGQTVTLAQQQTPEQNNPAVTPEQSTSIEVNDEEIQSFASAFEVVQTIQDESRQKMVEAIEEQGLTIKEYNELLRQQQQPESGDSETSNVSEEKQEQFQQADAQIEQIEQDAQADIEAAITDEGLQIERFQEIWIAVRQDPELQQQVKNYLEN